MTTKRTRHVLTATMIASALALTGCGGDGASGSSSSSAPQPSTSAGQASWQQQDPCALLSTADTKLYVGDEPVTGQRADAMGRPSCEWKGTGSGRIKLQLWQPPVPDIITGNSKRKFDIAGKAAFVTTETELSCHMNVQAEPAFLQIEARTSDTEKGQPQFCDTVAETAKLALTKLGW